MHQHDIRRGHLGKGALVALGLAAAGTAAAATALAGTASAATTPATHTLRLTAVQLSDVVVKDVDVATDQDLQQGQVTGYDVTSCAIDLRAHASTCQAAVARADGMIFGRARVDLTTGRGHGKITGGRGAYAGARGTITIRATGPDSTDIVLAYRT